MRRALVLLCAGAAMAAATGYAPARRLDGPPPRIPSPLTVGWVEEAADLTVDAAGRVEKVLVTRGGRPVESMLAAVTPGWRFKAATDGDDPVRSHVLVVLEMRPPQLYDEPSPGEPARELAAPSLEMPYPIASRRARYPPRALGDNVVVVEALVGADGHVSKTDVVQGTGAFADEAAATAQAWQFRPAMRNRKAVDAYVYLVFGFRQPTIQGSRGRPGR